MQGRVEGFGVWGSLEGRGRACVPPGRCPETDVQQRLRADGTVVSCLGSFGALWGPNPCRARLGKPIFSGRFGLQARHSVGAVRHRRGNHRR